MSSVSAALGESSVDHPLKDAFLKWQCRVRQMIARDNQGRPDASITPQVFLAGEKEALGQVITVLNKAPAYSVTSELLHLSRKTNDPAHWRSQALNFFSATHYQKHREFSDILTATFPFGSKGAAKILEAGKCTLVFDAYAQRFELACKVWNLARNNPLSEATMAHNRLFNPGLSAETVVLAFESDWEGSSSDPELT